MRRFILVLIAAVGALALAACGSTHNHFKTKHFYHGKEASKLAAPPRAGLKALPRVAARPVVPNKPDAPNELGLAWTVPYADSFAVPIGSGPGQDASWKANNHDQGCCNNSDEIDAERESHVHTGEHGLEATCTKEANAGHAYTCGGADGNTPAGFKWKWGGGQTWAFQTKAKWPPASNCGEDPGWWGSDPTWKNEIDFFEGWGWNTACKYSGGIPVYIYATPSSSIRLQCLPWEGCETWVPDPDGAFHIYTTIVFPDNTIRAYIDGREMGKIGPTPGTPNSSEYEHLIVTHALRQSTKLTGESVFAAEYTAVYEVGSGNTQNAHIAPGTVVEGKEPTPEPEPKPEPEPVKTETTPTPPPPAAPAVPTGCKAEGFLEGTAGKTRASCSTPPTGVSIEWQRTGPWTCSGQTVARFPIWTTGNSITNGLCVERGKRYDWSARTHNSTGTSAWTTPLPAYTP